MRAVAVAAVLALAWTLAVGVVLGPTGGRAVAATEVVETKVKLPKRATGTFKFEKASGNSRCAEAFEVESQFGKIDDGPIPVFVENGKLVKPRSSYINGYRVLTYRASQLYVPIDVAGDQPPGADDGPPPVFFKQQANNYHELTILGIGPDGDEGIAGYGIGVMPQLKALRRLLEGVGDAEAQAALRAVQAGKVPRSLEKGLKFKKGACWYHVQIWWSKKTQTAFDRLTASLEAELEGVGGQIVLDPDPRLGPGATVGVVDQESGLWYLVDPILADLSGDDEVPAGDLSGSGRSVLTTNTRDGKFCFGLELDNLQGIVSAAHVHAGAAGTNGPVVLDLDWPNNGKSGCVEADAALIDAILADLDAYYVNVHTDTFPDGAIRGQLRGGPRPPFFFGDPGDDPFLGDWDGDGIDTPGLYRPSDGKVYLRNSNTPGIADIEFFFGDPEDVPLIGDWDGDGDDTVSLYRPSAGQVFIHNTLGSGDLGLGTAEIEFLFGDPGDDPFGADFDGDGRDTVGLRRGDVFWWRNSLDAGPFDNDGLTFGEIDDEPMFGDWDGDGLETPGVYRPSTSTIFLRNLREPGIADMEIFADGFESGDTSAWSTGR